MGGACISPHTLTSCTECNCQCSAKVFIYVYIADRVSDAFDVRDLIRCTAPGLHVQMACTLLFVLLIPISEFNRTCCNICGVHVVRHSSVNSKINCCVGGALLRELLTVL